MSPELFGAMCPTTINCTIKDNDTVIINGGVLLASLNKSSMITIATAAQRTIGGGEDITLDLMGMIDKLEKDTGKIIDRSALIPITEEQYFDINFYKNL